MSFWKPKKCKDSSRKWKRYGGGYWQNAQHFAWTNFVYPDDPQLRQDVEKYLDQWRATLRRDGSGNYAPPRMTLAGRVRVEELGARKVERAASHKPPSAKEADYAALVSALEEELAVKEEEHAALIAALEEKLAAREEELAAREEEHATLLAALEDKLAAG